HWSYKHNGAIALLVAIQEGREDAVLELLTRYSGVDAVTGWTVLHMAAMLGRECIVDELLKRSVDEDVATMRGETSLHVAAAKGHSGTVIKLLTSGASVDAVHKRFRWTRRRATLMSWRTWSAHQREVGTKLTTALAIAVRSRQPRVVTQLLQLGAGPNARDKKNSIPLHAAAVCNFKAVVAELLAYGADPSAANTKGSTPLYKAAGRGYKEIVAMLLRGGADVKVVESNSRITGRAAFHLASIRGYADIVVELLANGADMNAVCNNGDPSLHIAAARRRYTVVAQLLAHGANPNASNSR
ncbi:hypothetical protein PybrP1_001023, partial [[Pythium] brassicae (nom. inval.)]